ncbi:hypothetical protein [Anaeromyxobacter diazotrophicus]|uniref:Outer membrane protein beta-barrel domain-containing protein n=1 Tax=Anaeromyxobacter diazotrophicus TaxID=2590199 RepID=A0A7I9VSF8_9BACT|nr:hypothetical protein [Anaeromyxobacter diazotrophicus]GEJ59383.1 hypothetical protein AMYX_41240 [Anaeromyxobacter diazotrophicus]
MKIPLLASLCALAPALALAQPAPAAGPAGAGASGWVVSVGVGGGVVADGGAQYASAGLFEGELGAGYEVGLGLRPELSVALGLAPSTHLALRPGLHWDLPDLPLYVRGALDWSSLEGSGDWRWLLTGCGAAVQLTDVLGGFAEADLGLPLVHSAGVGVLVRAGVSFRL